MAIIDKAAWRLEKQILFEGADMRLQKNMHLKCVKAGIRYAFCRQAYSARIYMIWKRAHKPAIILQNENAAREPREWNYFSYGEDIFLLPSHAKARTF